MLLVHHVVARPQLQRVDDVASPARHPSHVARARARAPGQVRLREHGQVQRLGHEPRTDGRGHDQHHAALGLLLDRRDEPGRNLRSLELLDHPLRGTVPLGGQHEPPAGLLEHADVGDGAVDLAAVPLDVPGIDDEGPRGGREVVVGHPGQLGRSLVPGGGVARPRRTAVEVLVLAVLVLLRVPRRVHVQRERAHGPPAQPAHRRETAHLGERREARRRQVQRGRRTGRRRRPRRREELLRRRDEVVRPAPHALRVDEHQQTVVAHQVQHRHHAVHQRRGERLHALDRDPLREPIEHVGGTGQLLDELRRALAYRVRQQDLPARRRPHPVLGHLEAALVGHREPADLLDVLTPQLDPQRVVLGGREHVDDPAAHRELAAPLDHVDARVGRVHEVLGQRRQVHPVPRADRHRLQVPQPVDHRLQQRADGDHEHADRSRVARALRVLEPSEHREPFCDRVAAWRETLVRQRLPGRQDRDVVGGQVAADRRGELVRVPSRRRHHDQRALRRERGQQRWADAGRADHVQLAAGACGVDRLGGGGVGEEGGEQTAEVHGVLPGEPIPGTELRAQHGHPGFWRDPGYSPSLRAGSDSELGVPVGSEPVLSGRSALSRQSASPTVRRAEGVGLQPRCRYSPRSTRPRRAAG